MEKKKERTSTIQSVDKALDILCSFSVEEPELGITELASKLGLYKSTIHRILKTLEDRGFIVQNFENQKYRLGFKLFDLGNAVVSRLEVKDVALPLMKELSAKTRETVTLNIIDNDQRVCIEKVESSEAVRNFVQIGGRNPLYLAASGKVLLAFLPNEEIERIIASKDLGVTVLGQLIKQDTLRSELQLIRQRGYAISKSERSLGSTSVAAPIRNHDGTVVAGISVSGPESRFNEVTLGSIISEVMETAKRISNRLGWRQ